MSWKPSAPLKPGVKTSEFWLALIVTVAGSVAGAYASHPWAQVLGAVSAALASAGYSFSRAQVKAAQIPMEDNTKPPRPKIHYLGQAMSVEELMSVERLNDIFQVNAIFAEEDLPPEWTPFTDYWFDGATGVGSLRFKGPGDVKVRVK